MSLLTLARPPTSSQATLGIFGAPVVSEYEARMFASAISKSVFVKTAWSKGDEYPDTRLALQL